MKKRIIAAVLAVMLIISAVGCGNGAASSGDAVDNSGRMEVGRTNWRNSLRREAFFALCILLPSLYSI